MEKYNEEEMYENKICKYCTNKDKCDKSKFKVYKINDKITYRCYSYNYINKEDF